MMKPKRKAERRCFPRFFTDVRAQCFHVLSDGTAEKATVHWTGVWGKEGESPQSKGVVKDLSFGGLYLESKQPFREGTILVIELQLPRRKAKIVVIGLVRWVKEIKKEEKEMESLLTHGLGVQFIYMQKADWEILQKLVSVQVPGEGSDA